MKVEHPIRINTARAKDPAWRRLAAVGSPDRPRKTSPGLQVDITRVPAACTSGRLSVFEDSGRLSMFEDSVLHTDWGAVCHSRLEPRPDLAPVRGASRKIGGDTGASRPFLMGLPRLDRIREFKRLLLDLSGHFIEASGDPDVPQLRRKQLTGICRRQRTGGPLWTAYGRSRFWHRNRRRLQVMNLSAPCNGCDRNAAFIRSSPIINRSHLIGHGVLVSTIHAAKGLEFDHVTGARRSPGKSRKGPHASGTQQPSPLNRGNAATLLRRR